MSKQFMDRWRCTTTDRKVAETETKQDGRKQSLNCRFVNGASVLFYSV